mgnify:CR=1 FL=1
MMKALLLSLLFVVPAFAGPPEGARNLMIPYPSICTPGMTEMMSALTEDYAVHISMTFEESPTTGIVVLHNPNTKTAAVLHIREDRTCIVFSGQNLKMFDRPEGMAPPKVELEDFKES